MVDRASTSVSTDLVDRLVAATDNSIYQVTPRAVATPTTVDELVAIIAANHAGADPLPIVARGGGTGTNAQSLTDGLVVDVKRHLDHIIEIDPATRTAVVEPGVVATALDRALAPHGLAWAPHTSTVDRATVGGMLSTDAAGKGSLVHGRTHRHVTALDLCLADGTVVHLAPTSLEEAERIARRPDATGALWRSLLDLPIREGDFDATVGGTPITPGLARAWTGYGVDRFRRDGSVDPVQLVVGAEGTLGVVTKVWLRLVERPAGATLVAAAYDSFDDALRASLELASLEPSAIETIDEATLDAARSSPAWPALASVVGDRPGALLLLEFEHTASRAPVYADLIVTEIIGRSPSPRSVETTTGAAERRAIWRVRADAVGLLARIVDTRPGIDGRRRSARPTAMVEDCAVPVATLPEFITAFRELLDDAGLRYGMFGHADVGCVHVRPALDLTDPAHEELVAELTARVVDLVDDHGGVLWGEHGRGVRGRSAERILSPELHHLMRAVKSAFDPTDRCNPGKLYRPLAVTEPILGVDDLPTRGALNRRIPIDVRDDHASAFACNGNGLCHSVDEAAPMCPSYQATGDPAFSPKGRSDLIRAWLAGDIDASFDDDLARNLDRCLSCAACSGRCPVEVDVPELKSRFLESYHRRRRRPLAHHLLSRFETLAPIVARLPALLRRAVAPVGRLVGLDDLPTPGGRPSRRLTRFDADRPGQASETGGTGGTGEMVILADVFTGVLEPTVAVAAVEVLERAGFAVSVSPLEPSGKFDHVVGRRRRFARAVSRQRALVEQVVDTGATPVVIEPAVFLLHRHEYLQVDPAHPAGAVRSLADVLAEHPLPAHDVAARRVTLIGHCTERARSNTEIDRWASVLRAAGHTVSVVDTGCCGMAGAFGHQREQRHVSERLWQQNWAVPVGEATDVVAAIGASCRSQTTRFGARTAVHPVELL